MSISVQILCFLPVGFNTTIYFDVFLTVHHIIDSFHLPTLMHNFFIH